MKIPFVDLKAQYQSIRTEVDEAISRVLINTDYIGGEELKRFERAFADSLGTKHCIPVGNGTDALYIVLRAMGIGKGDQVITVANSFIASSEAISQTGARPVFVDCDPSTYTIDIAKVEERLKRPDANTIKAIIPVHLYGRVADMKSLMALARKHGLKVLEDCAQAHYAEYEGKMAGTFGDAATFSFYPGKNLGAYGDAGAIVTSDDSLALKMRMFANHGRVAKYDHEIEGINSRMDTLQAAVLNVKLRHIRDWTRMRQANAKLYREYLGEVPGLTLPEIPSSHVFHLFVIRVKNRDQLAEKLKAKDIATGIHYPIALPNLKAYAYLGHQPSDFPVSTRYQEEILSLPMYPELSVDQIKYVADQVKGSI